MSTENRKSFLKWYEEHKDDVFDFKKEMERYCRSDVDILSKCCLEFRHQFIELAGVDPFCYVTIAASCMACYRSAHLSPETIGMVTVHGYANGNYSMDGIRWLDFVAFSEGIHISHALNGRGETGCFYHGCDKCFDPDAVNPLSGETMDKLRRQTSAVSERLRDKGYQLVEMWEHDFKEMMSNDLDMKSFLENHEVVDRLNPRDAFFGSRTKAVKLIHEGKAKYIDFTSLYPWCNKYCRYPIGHPSIITNNFDDLDKYFGLIKCKVLPPRKLFHPVLPYRSQGKLLFPLCRVSCMTNQQEPCTHSDQERSLTGTWVIEEMKKAVEKGYIIFKVFEVYHFEESSSDLFKSYIDLFLKLKQKASGWPEGCNTEKEKDRYIQSCFEKEGVLLRKENIKLNPGQRALSKLALNSFWGRWGMSLIKMMLNFVGSLEEFNKYLSDNTKEIQDVFFPTDKICGMQWKQRAEFIDGDQSTNIFIAAFTTCHARLKLYNEIDKLGNGFSILTLTPLFMSRTV
nr:uncharacterized protein LOC107451653 [Parasteatoda tepidariorum]